MDFTVTIPDLPKFIDNIGAASTQAQTLSEAAIRKSVDEIQTLARSAAPHKTGTLQRSILADVKYPNGTVTVQELYGTYIEFGTKPHDILPKKAKALFWAGAAHPMKKVHHPGTAPNPFFERAIETAKPDIQQNFAQVTQLIINKMKG